MRKGYTIIEIISITAFLALVFMLMTEPLRIVISEVPRQHQEFGVAQSMDHMLDRLKTDIEAAKELHTEPNTLLVAGDRETILYHFEAQQVQRQVGPDPNSICLWTLPNSRLAWEVRNQTGLQITSWLERTLLGKTDIKFHNSHLFCVKGIQSGESQ